MKEPSTSFEFVKEWFEKAHKEALKQRKGDSAALWKDGLEHLCHLNTENDALKQQLADAMCCGNCACLTFPEGKLGCLKSINHSFVATGIKNYCPSHTPDLLTRKEKE